MPRIFERSSKGSRSAAWGFAGSALLHGAIAVLLLRPLLADPARTLLDTNEAGWGRLLAADVNLNLWILTWVSRALLSSPLSLFDAGIFHPAPAALAYSEHMLGHQPIFLPVYVVSQSHVLAHQMNILLSLALCGASMQALARHWGLSWPAAFLAGFIYAFCPLRAFGIAHVQHIAGQYLPLALLFLDRTLRAPRMRDAAAFALFLVLQFLCSYYLAYVAIFAIASYAIAIAMTGKSCVSRRGVAVAAIASAVALSLLTWTSLPYARLQKQGVIPDQGPSIWLRAGSASWLQRYITRQRQGPSPSLYLGLLPVGLALLGLFHRRLPPSLPWVKAGALAMAGCGYVLALGPVARVGSIELPLPYRAALSVVPGFEALRAPFRFGFLLIVGFAPLAAMGVEVLLTSLPRRIALLSGLLIPLATALDYGLFSHRFAVRPAPEPTVIDRELAKLPRGPVLELPERGADDNAGIYRESEAMVRSLHHRMPLCNGHSGHTPPSYWRLMTLAGVMPDAHATELLARAAGLRYVIVHLDKLGPRRRARFASSTPEGLRLLASHGDDRLYEVVPRREPDLVGKLIDFRPASETLLGTPLRAIPPEGRRAEVVLEAPQHLAQGRAFKADVFVTNRSEHTWPVLVTVGDHIVRLSYRWSDTEGRELLSGTGDLPYDLAPGASSRIPLIVRTPAKPGRAELQVGVVQDGRWFGETASVWRETR